MLRWKRYAPKWVREYVNRYLVYATNCKCVCGCVFFCRIIDDGLCDFCAEGHHSLVSHQIEAVWEPGGSVKYSMECVHCGMPEYMTGYFNDRCPGVPPSSLKPRTILRRGFGLVARRLLDI